MKPENFIPIVIVLVIIFILLALMGLKNKVYLISLLLIFIVIVVALWISIYIRQCIFSSNIDLLLGTFLIFASVILLAYKKYWGFLLGYVGIFLIILQILSLPCSLS